MFVAEDSSSMDSMEEIPPMFVEEINAHELQFGEVVGRGAFGLVSRAVWRGMDVAVKLIETESERKAFITELKQLSRVSHPNIVHLYGACTITPVCLVMEYAEGGSLYNVLHGNSPQPGYTAAHAFSWCLQCALGVTYLHSMKPKPLIHRDLKPPNLLLQMGGTVLKICDFGTACDAHTHMTNNKGSAAWMAPEVFEGSNYSEKCDVFSFGIILWEVLTRRKPFDEIGGPAFRIMWAVHRGKRPPLIRNCPKPVEKLMTRCWSSNPVERPPIAEVVRIMTIICEYFQGGQEPLVYPNLPTVEAEATTPQVNSSVYDTPPLTNPTQLPGETSGNTIRDTVHQALRAGMRCGGEAVPIVHPLTPRAKPVVVEDRSQQFSHTSAPPSISASRESLLDGKGSRSSTPNMDFVNKRYSADLSRLEEVDIMRAAAAIGGGGAAAYNPKAARGHRRTGSHGTPFVSSASSNSLLVPNWSQSQAPASVRGHRRTGSYGNSPVVSAEIQPGGNNGGSPSHLPSSSSSGCGDALEGVAVQHSVTDPGSQGGGLAGRIPTSGGQQLVGPPGAAYGSSGYNRSVSCMPDFNSKGNGAQGTNRPMPSSMSLDSAVQSMSTMEMDHRLQPLPPCPTCPESMEIFQEHFRLAEEYMRIQVEIALLNDRKEELSGQELREERDQQDSSKFKEEFTGLVSENEALVLLHNNLKKQVELIRT